MERKDYLKRVELLKELRNMGINPYPQSTPITNYIEEIVKAPENFMGKKVAVAGRLYALRFHGKVAFGDLRDNGSKIQGFFRMDVLGEEQYKFLKKYVDRGDFLWIKGEVTRTKKGELSVLAEEIKLASKALYDLPHEWFGIEDTEKRYRQRYLDLMFNKDAFDTFIKRSIIEKEIRMFLWNRGFLEMETPVLQPVYGGANAKPFKTHVNAIDRDYYLRISDELYLKRLIVGGYNKVFEIAKDFRNEDIDTTHNPEFTMIEIYQSYVDYNDMMNLTEEMIKHVAQKLEIEKVKFGEYEIDFTKPFRREKMLDMLAKRGIDENTSDEEIKAMLDEYKIKMPQYNRGLALGKLFERVCEEDLIQPVFVIDHPRETTPLCKLHRKDNRLIERFELYVGSVELANGYTELNDPLLQEKFFREEVERRTLGDEEAHQYDEDFIEALRWGMPPMGGVGIGIDRLTMLLTGNTSIKEVILFPILAPKK
ncbi:lysine--tRNA ligase [Candidatus Aciduliprofundum boonei]|uniref:Lysine--tRNA ligase n=1 Tax=Aciduliprofundum boonei (strain DSM 19572 / T469) TaxID=439481 RepID=B5I9T9_ACIB4|nr:lysine--tRNA ligase [Candidatus Aciduliprofundum boonei]ADD08430.1 lysyl-tRNA synthetase [Aciduliprofundum boonei T469]EDY36681.1 lysyl-tRNA synthetase [Aciduliprofundum boonei T469]HII55473.1 lysine--tRNA ligase [Candidatus Aciduliprofundum boonei]